MTFIHTWGLDSSSDSIRNSRQDFISCALPINRCNQYLTEATVFFVYSAAILSQVVQSRFPVL